MTVRGARNDAEVLGLNAMGAIAIGGNGPLHGDVHTCCFHLLCDRWLYVMVLKPGRMALGKKVKGTKGERVNSWEMSCSRAGFLLATFLVATGLSRKQVALKAESEPQCRTQKKNWIEINRQADKQE